MRRDKVKKIFSGDDEGIFAKMVKRRAAASEFDCLPSFYLKCILLTHRLFDQVAQRSILDLLHVLGKRSF